LVELERIRGQRRCGKQNMTKSHTTKLSHHLTASFFESYENPTATIEGGVDASDVLATRLPISKSQICIIPSSDPPTSSLLSLEISMNIHPDRSPLNVFMTPVFTSKAFSSPFQQAAITH